MHATGHGNYKQLCRHRLFFMVVGAGKECRSTFSFSATTRGHSVWHSANRTAANLTVSGLTHAVQHCSTFQLDYLCALFFSLQFLRLKNPRKKPSVSLFELEFKWVDLKMKNLMHSHTPPPQVQSPKTEIPHLHRQRTFVFVCGLAEGRASNPHHVFVQSSWVGVWIFWTRKTRWMELVFNQSAYF